MTNRHRFWMQAVAVVAALALMAGCTAPPSRSASAHRSPSLGQSLTPSGSVITPYSNVAADEEAILAGQKVVKIGLLVPLSGRNAELGKALRDAAAVSLFDKYARLSVRAQTVRVELIPKDTGDTTEQATTAMQQALEEGAQFIIGPLFADAAAASAPLARAKNINVLSFSNTRTQASPGTYMFGFSPAEQTERIISYALANGKTKIAVLVPNSPLGETVLTAARGVALKSGIKLAAESKYMLQGTGMDTALSTLVQPGKTPTFDAILIPEGGTALDTILRGLNARGVKPSTVQFLGTGLWDDADLLRRVNLDTAWFASSSPTLTSQFETRFRTTYDYAPPRIASLAYDAVALAVTLATSNRPFDAVTLTSAAGFSGPANGIFRLRADGTTQRGLAVMQVQGGGLKIISPAPNGF
jgi:branched-chain amino acid transport system substrate-binding protein